MTESEQLEEIYNAIKSNPEQSIELRILKIGEEFGEVSEALLGVLGANTRKGESHNGEDVAKELGDVAITVLVALYDWVEFPIEFVSDCISTVHARVKEKGS